MASRTAPAPAILTEGLAAWLLLLVPGAALAAAFTIEHLGGWAPCHLCIVERWIYVAAMLVALFGIVTKRARLGILLAVLILLGNAAVSLWHTGIELGWFALPGGCVAGGDAQSLDDLRAQLAASRPTCDRALVVIAGLSLAAWNAILAIALAGLGAAALIRSYRS